MMDSSIDDEYPRVDAGLRWPPIWSSIVISVGVTAATAAVGGTDSVSYFAGLALVVGSCHRFNHMLVNEALALLHERSRRLPRAPVVDPGGFVAYPSIATE